MSARYARGYVRFAMISGVYEMIQCPNCNTMMNETAQFCPGCDVPRTAVRERLERQAAETGEPYQELLNLARAEDFRNRALTGFSNPVTPPVYTPPIERPQKSNKLWWILGGVGGGFLLICVACVVMALVVRDQAGISFGEGEAGAVIRRQLELAEQGQHQERWRLLHPKQREELPAATFVNCAQGRTISGVEIFLEHNEVRDVPFVGDKVETRAVNYVYVLNGESLSGIGYVVKDADDLYWTLTLDEIAAYRTGACP